MLGGKSPVPMQDLDVRRAWFARVLQLGSPHESKVDVRVGTWSENGGNQSLLDDKTPRRMERAFGGERVISRLDWLPKGSLSGPRWRCPPRPSNGRGCNGELVRDIAIAVCKPLAYTE